MSTLLFFSAVDNNYEDFLFLYIYFANKYNENAHFEFIIKNLNDNFTKKIDNFKNKFGIKNIVLRNSTNEISANRLRFLEEPITKCDYTYIGDVDIFINESIKEFHIDRIDQNDTIYDNCIRLTNRDKLSGLHFVKTKEWYDATRNIRTSLCKCYKPLKIDEAMLFDIAKMSNIKIYENETFERPIHGLHISLNRVPFTEKLSFPWGLYKSMFIDDFFKSEDFEKIKEFLSEYMLNILETCTNYTIDKSNKAS